jgi:hypothetical protein
MNKTFLEGFGWYGAVAILAAYFLNSFGVIGHDSVVYQGLNVTGAIGIVLVSYAKRAYQPMALNAIWTLIGIAALIKIIARM